MAGVGARSHLAGATSGEGRVFQFCLFVVWSCVRLVVQTGPSWLLCSQGWRGAAQEGAGGLRGRSPLEMHSTSKLPLLATSRTTDKCFRVGLTIPKQQAECHTSLLRALVNCARGIGKQKQTTTTNICADSSCAPSRGAGKGRAKGSFHRRRPMVF